MSLGPVSRLIAWVLVLLLLKWTWPYAGLALGLLLGALDWLFGLVFGISALAILWAVFDLCLRLSMLLGVIALLVPKMRKTLGGVPRTTLRLITAMWKLALPAFRFAFCLLRAIAQGTQHHEPTNKEKKTRRSLPS